TYMNAEPYRTMVRTNLARVQFLRAITQRGLSRREALDKLRQSRETKKDEVSLLAYVIAFVAIVTPLGATVATLPQFRFVRRLLGRIARYRDPGFGWNRPKDACHQRAVSRSPLSSV